MCAIRIGHAIPLHRTLRPLLLALLLLTAGLASATEPGGDAPGTWASAVNVGEGVIEGAVDASDTDDWYRVEAPAGHYVRVTLDVVAGHGYFDVLTDGGWWVDWHYVSDNGWYESLVVVSRAGASRLGVSTWGSLAYVLTVEHVRVPDVAVWNLTVTPQPLGTDHGPVPLYPGTLRTIAVEVANVGPSSATGAVHVDVTTVTDARTTRVASAPVTLEPGEVQTLEITWNTLTTGAVGDLVVTATAQVPFDANAANDARSVRHYALASGSGVGLTARASGGGCHGFLVYECPGYSVGPDGAVLQQHTYVYFLAAQGTVADASPRSFGASTYAAAPFVYVAVGGHHAVGPGGRAFACAYVFLGTCASSALP